MLDNWNGMNWSEILPAAGQDLLIRTWEALLLYFFFFSNYLIKPQHSPDAVVHMHFQRRHAAVQMT